GNVATSKNPALPGEQLDLTFALSAVAPGSGTPAGTVQFRIDGAPAGSPVPVVARVATYSPSSLPAGTHTVLAEYPGDSNFTGTTNTLPTTLLINTPPVASTDAIDRYPTNGTKVEIATLLTNDTDADGDPVGFLGVNPTSVNGGTVSVQGGWIYYEPPPGYTNVDFFNYSITDGHGTLVTGLVIVRLKSDGPALNLTIADLGNGSYRLRFSGIPNRFCIIQYTPTLNPPNWLTLVSGTSDPFGVFQYTDTPPGGTVSRWYRSLYP